MKDTIEAILGRKEYNELLHNVSGKVILVTGANGSIGLALRKRLPYAVFTDIEDIDVTDSESIAKYAHIHFDCIINLAGAKHAPEGETNPEETLRINTLGVLNLIRAFPNTKIIQASTCKACNPETVYGASKLISERIVLNAGGVVARFYNVIQTSGNVFEIWQNQDESERVAYEAERYFITIEEVCGLIVHCITLPTGRYIVPSIKRSITKDIAPVFNINKFNERRKGDRYAELHHSTSEVTEQVFTHIHRVISYHD